MQTLKRNNKNSGNLENKLVLNLQNNQSLSKMFIETSFSFSFLTFLLFLSKATALSESAEEMLKDKLQSLEDENFSLKKQLEAMSNHRDLVIFYLFNLSRSNFNLKLVNSKCNNNKDVYKISYYSKPLLNKNNIYLYVQFIHYL